MIQSRNVQSILKLDQQRIVLEEKRFQLWQRIERIAAQRQERLARLTGGQMAQYTRASRERQANASVD